MKKEDRNNIMRSCKSKTWNEIW